MKTAVLALVLAGSVAQAKINLSGSDTLGGVMTDAIIAAGLNNDLTYVGGGSGVGEKAIANGEVGIAPMSRQMKPEFLAQAQQKGIALKENVIGLDGVILLVNGTVGMNGLDIPTIVRIFKCEVTTWDQVSGSGKTGPINAFRRNDASGTTDTFKTLTGLKAFGACVTVVAETHDITERTSNDPNAIGYAGLSGKAEKNKALSIAATTGAAYVAPTAANIRSEKYPLSRKLYVYSASGAKSPSAPEARLLASLLNKSFINPILKAHDFVTLQ